MSAIDDLANVTPVVPPMSAELEAELDKLVAVPTRRPWKQLATLVAISFVYGAGVLAIVSVRRDLREIPMTWMLGAGVVWLLGFVFPAYLAVVPAPGAVSPRFRQAAILAALVAVFFVVFGLSWDIPSGAHSDHYDWDRFARGHTCLEIGLATALAPVIAGAIFLRGALPVGARATAAALGASGGCMGGLVLHLHCYITDNLHIGLVHGGVVVVAAALAALLVPRATEIRGP